MSSPQYIHSLCVSAHLYPEKHSTVKWESGFLIKTFMCRKTAGKACPTASIIAVFNMQNQTYIYSSYELICILYTKNRIHFEIRCIANIAKFYLFILEISGIK